MIEEDRLIEYACYCGNYYGTPRDYVEDQMEQGRDVILEIELQGALKIKEKYPEALLLFVMPPDTETLINRLRSRGTESEEVIRQRLQRAVEESKQVDQYEYIVINDDLDQSVEEVHRLIDSQHNKAKRNMDFIRQIQEEIREYTENE